MYQPGSSSETASSSSAGAPNQDAPNPEDVKPLSTASETKGEAENDAEPKSIPEKDNPNPASEEGKEKTTTTPKPADPLKWFGILVPPALRTAQATFVDAVEGPIPRLATIAREMRLQEIEIGRVKKQIKKM